MKSNTTKISLVFTLFFTLAALLSIRSDAEESSRPYIRSIQSNRGKWVIHVDVPKGLRKVTLQTKNRAEGSVWTPRLVNRLDGNGGITVFYLTSTTPFELIRVQANSNEPLPEAFYRGTNDFSGAAGGSTTGTGFPGDVNSGTTGGSPNPPPNEEGGRDVVESDIWKIEGNMVYFFNALRGLQVIDATNPDAPMLKSQYPLPGRGEQMYVRDGVVLLLAQSSCDGGSVNDQSTVVMLDTRGSSIQKLAEVTVPGTIRESRLVGDALYVVSQTYQGNVDGTWEWGAAATSFDISNPAAPIKMGTYWLPGYGNVISATDRFLFVVQNNQMNETQQQEVHLFDISSPTGEMKKLSTIRPAGQVPDKFKINVKGDTLTIISQAWNATDRWLTVLETFSLADPANPQKLGRLELARGEQLHATRFDGDRAYIVTFMRVDPLWVVDLSNPLEPKIAGELEVPGWSTYIRPLGDRLISIGIDADNGWKVAVSLFDVSNPAKPSLLDKEFLGENHSWSEANYDEKAFNVLPEEGLILVPYQGYLTNGYAQNVQLIDFDQTSLTKRGQIKHAFQPRRAGMLKERILSISAQQLIAVNATDRDEPTVSATLTLATAISKVYPHGDFVVAIQGNNQWNRQIDNAGVQIYSKEALEAPLAQLSLSTNLPIVGSAKKGSLLYLLQSSTGLQVTAEEATNPPPSTLTVVDLSAAPQLTMIWTSSVPANISAFGTATDLWPNDHVLVFRLENNYGYYFGDWGMPPIWGDAVGGGGFWHPFWTTPQQFIAWDLSDPMAPHYASSVTIKANSGWWNSGKAFAINNLVYSSHTQYEEKMVVVPGTELDGTSTTKLWGQNRNYLDVIDYTDPDDPIERTPASLPNPLEGISHDGDLLYTAGYHYSPEGEYRGNTNWLDALAYDGVSAYLVDSYPLNTTYWMPFRVTTSGNIYLGTPATTNSAPEIVTLRLNNQGKFAEIGRTVVNNPAQAFQEVNDVLLVQSYADVIPYVEVQNQANFTLLPLSSGVQIGCIGLDIQRAEGSKAEGIWLPLFEYGLMEVPTE